MAGGSKPYLKLALLGALFLLLTAAGIAWAVQSSDSQLAHLGRLGDVAPGVVGVVIGCSLALLGADMLRFRVAGAAVGVEVSWLACWDATVAMCSWA